MKQSVVSILVLLILVAVLSTAWYLDRSNLKREIELASDKTGDRVRSAKHGTRAIHNALATIRMLKGQEQYQGTDLEKFSRLRLFRAFADLYLNREYAVTNPAIYRVSYDVLEKLGVQNVDDFPRIIATLVIEQNIGVGIQSETFERFTNDPEVDRFIELSLKSRQKSKDQE